MSETRRFIGMAAGAILLFGMVGGLACAKKSSESSAGAAPQAPAPMERADGQAAKVAGELAAPGVAASSPAPPESGGEATPKLEGHFLAEPQVARERLLEYRVELTYESTDLQKSRLELLRTIGHFGFVRESNASVEGTRPFLATELLVRSEKLLEALGELDRIGALRTERIAVTDHTEGMVSSARQARREEVRIARKLAASKDVAASSRNWNDVEASIARSEDTLDAAEQEKWKIGDRVEWASVHVDVRAPVPPLRIDVPRYHDAWVGVVNSLLRFGLALIRLLPALLVIGLVLFVLIRSRRLFARLLRRDASRPETSNAPSDRPKGDALADTPPKG